METRRAVYDSDGEPLDCHKPAASFVDDGNEADDEGDTPSAMLAHGEPYTPLPPLVPDPVPAFATAAPHAHSPPLELLEDSADWARYLESQHFEAMCLRESVCTAQDLVGVGVAKERRHGSARVASWISGSSDSEPRESEDSDASFDHGNSVRDLRSGRYSKLEGKFFGDQKVGELTMHTQFLADEKASSGYNTLVCGISGWSVLECRGRKRSLCGLSAAQLRKARKESRNRSMSCCCLAATKDRTGGIMRPCVS